MSGKDLNSIKHKLTQGVRHFSGCFAMGSEDIMLGSFPRSGSTWFRTIFANCLNLKHGKREQASMKELAQIMPVLGFSKLGKNGPGFYRPRLIKTHRLPGEIKPFRPKQILHLWREPVGVMKSCFRYYRAHRSYQIKDVSTLVRNPRLGMPAWKKHYVDWSPIATVTLEYDNMRDNTVAEVSKVFQELGYEELLPFVGDAVELANLENMKKSEKQGIRNPERFDSNFSSIGGSTSDATKLSDSDMEYITSLSSDLEIGTPHK